MKQKPDAIHILKTREGCGLAARFVKRASLDLNGCDRFDRAAPIQAT